MSSSPDPTSAGVLRGAAADVAVSASFHTDLGRVGGRVPRVPAVDAELAAVKEAAKAAGFAAGWAEGKRAAKVESEAAQRAADEETRRFQQARAAGLQRALQTIAAAANALEQRAAPSAMEIENELVSAAFVLAEAVLGRELALADSPGRDAVARALELVPVGRPVLVRVNPADHATLTAEADHEGPLVIDGRTVTLEPDAALASGDAIAESDATVVDARLSAALLRVGEALGMVDAEDQPW
ncbi:FliH/SctL family protein [Cryptosporangium sp. NPDC048952]|uniref:FliH/SctL family protein n=1 Tax=Cryptosporangium sp. NPDC048952 TaxID=3363961 RepID=UPI0037125D4C